MNAKFFRVAFKKRVSDSPVLMIDIVPSNLRIARLFLLLCVCFTCRSLTKRFQVQYFE